MSGITGIWNLDGEPVERSAITRFNDTLKLRGPDRSNVIIDDSLSFALGQRRYLRPGSLDLEDQTLAYGSDRYRIAIDGEIQNTSSLRKRLQLLGYQFASEEDAEVVLASYRQWGPECQHKFDGKWALAIWDRHERVLFLARDRFGQKPLYYCRASHRFAFASELKAFLALPWFDASFDSVYVTTAIRARFHLLSRPETFLQHARQLEPGYCLTINQEGQLKQERWWRTIDHLERPLHDFKRQVERFQELFSAACALQMPENEAVGVSLSGGIDSTSVLATICHLLSNEADIEPSGGSKELPVQAYVGYPDDPGRDERALAKTLIQQIGVGAHYEPFSGPTEAPDLDALLFQHEDIIMVHESDTIARAMARDKIACAFTGNGAGSLFGASFSGINTATAEALEGVPNPLRVLEMLRLRQGQLSVTGQSGLVQRSKVLAYSLGPIAKYLLKGRDGFRPDRPRYFADADLFNNSLLTLNFPDYYEDCRQINPNQLHALNRYFSLHNGLNVTVCHHQDRAFMHTGVEWRSPFLDWRLVCFALSLPSESIIRGMSVKPIIREAMRGRLPELIRTNKSNMALVNSAVGRFWKMKNIVLETINQPFFLDSELWRGRALAARIKQAYKEHNYNNVTMLWRCVCAARLQQAFMEKSREYLDGLCESTDIAGSERIG